MIVIANAPASVLKIIFNFWRHHPSVTNWTGKRRIPPQWSKIAAKGKLDPNMLETGPPSVVALPNRDGM
ncbi:hypothetical protein FJ944_14110 [Mesorhizobium sp. B2-4-11]|nr:hypothetical protein FJ944_14110 [Mesorhizobium sp. B2-4-11]